MKIAIVGSGISGLTSAYLLAKKHDVVLYEAADRIGGHTATMDVNYQNTSYAIDTGFIVFNDRTYPNFQKLLEQLSVDYQKTDMGFSVSCDITGLEYSGDNLNTLFAQRRNIFSRSHWIMIKDILRFNKEAPLYLLDNNDDITLGEYLLANHYSSVFIDKYLIPMGAAIWSASTSVMQQFPLKFFIQFFVNHGLLNVNNRPQWYVIKGGSKSYIDPLIASFKDSIKLSSAVVSIVRQSLLKGPSGDVTNDLKQPQTLPVKITTANGDVDYYDHVIVASHSDQALALLDDASAAEKEILGAIDYRDNEVVLHTDHTLLPKNPLTWSSWNYRIINDSSTTDESISKALNNPTDKPPALTYNMNILQGIQSPCTFCVTLNSTENIAKASILGTYHYAHPVFTAAAVKAQSRWKDINGIHNTWYCGAYWGNGFHEDGVSSAVRIAKAFDITL